MSPTRATWDIARSTGHRAVGAESRGCSRMIAELPSDGSTGGIGGGNCGRIDARREHRRAARSRGPEGGTAAVLVREAKAALFLSRQLGRRLDGTAAVLPMWGRTPPGAARCGQVRADLVDVRCPGLRGRAGQREAGRLRAPGRRRAATRAALRRARSWPEDNGGSRSVPSVADQMVPRSTARRAAAIGSLSPETQKSWRRPIFPKGCPLSIFGAGELDFRVRDGNGYGLSARVTRIRCVWTFGSGPRGTRLVSRRGAPRIDLRSRESQSGNDPDFPATDPWSVAEEVKPSTVSTAQLHPSPDFHMPPI